MKKIYALMYALVVLTMVQAQPATTANMQQVSLGLQLEKGHEYSLVTSARSTITQNIQGQEIQTALTITGKMTYLVKEVLANGYDMEVRYTSLGMSMSMPGGTLEVDTEKPDPSNPFSAILSAMTGKAFGVRMSKTGSIESVAGIENLFNTMFEKAPALGEAEKKQIKQQMMDAFGENALKGSIEMTTAIFPATPVAPGSRWEIKTRMSGTMDANVTSTYTLKEITPGGYIIMGNSSIVTDRASEKISNGMPMAYDMNGTMRSEIKVDRKTGWIIEAKMLQELKGETFIKPTDQIPNGMVIQMTTQTESVITGK